MDKRATLDEVIENAQQAFWSTVAAAYPEIKTGDLDPGSVVSFEIACRTVGENWATWNCEEDGVLRSTCDFCQKPMRWLAAPTGGWWAHEEHPTDDHDAVFGKMSPQ